MDSEDDELLDDLPNDLGDISRRASSSSVGRRLSLASHIEDWPCLNQVSKPEFTIKREVMFCGGKWPSFKRVVSLVFKAGTFPPLHVALQYTLIYR